MHDVNIAVSLAAMLMIGTVFLSCLKERRVLQGLNGQFLPMLIVNLAMLGANTLLWAALKHGNDLLFRLCSCVSCVCYYAELALFLRYGAAFIARRVPVSPWYVRISTAVCAVSAAGWTLSSFNDAFYSLSETGEGTPGPLYLLGQVGGYLVIALAVLLIVRYYRTLGRGLASLFLSFALFPVLAAIVRIFWRGVDLMPMMLSLSLMLGYSMVHVQESLDLRERELQTEKQRLTAALAQLQPQLLYRTLDDARALCATDSAAAQQTIAAFADHLRLNLDKATSQEENTHVHLSSGR